MFKKILVCVDPYPANLHLLMCAASLKQLGAEQIILAHVIVADAPGVDEMLLAQAGPELEKQKKILEEAGFAVVVEMPKGHPAQTLIDLAEKNDVSVIVIGTQGRGFFESLTLAASSLGNVSTKVLQKSRWPVLLVRNTAPTKKMTIKPCHLLSRVLFPTDFSDAAEVALTYLDSLVRAFHFPVTLLHVQEESTGSSLHPGRRSLALQKADENRMQRL